VSGCSSSSIPSATCAAIFDFSAFAAGRPRENGDPKTLDDRRSFATQTVRENAAKTLISFHLGIGKNVVGAGLRCAFAASAAFFGSVKAFEN
jgi:hypothetical protein